MPARTKSITKGKSGTAAPAKKFELPALKFNFESLTEGTDIPPPPPSPKVLTPPATPKNEKPTVTDEKAAVNGKRSIRRP